MKDSDKRFYQKDVLGVTILAPSKRHIEKIEKCLDFLSHAGVGEKVSQLNYIFVIPRRRDHNWLFAAQVGGSERIIFTVRPYFINGADIVYLASSILHEVHHVTQRSRGDDWETEASELEAVGVQRAFLVKHGTQDHVDWIDKCIEEKWWISKGLTRTNKSHLEFIKLLQDNELSIQVA